MTSPRFRSRLSPLPSSIPVTVRGAGFNTVVAEFPVAPPGHSHRRFSQISIGTTQTFLPAPLTPIWLLHMAVVECLPTILGHSLWRPQFQHGSCRISIGATRTSLLAPTGQRNVGTLTHLSSGFHLDSTIRLPQYPPPIELTIRFFDCFQPLSSCVIMAPLTLSPLAFSKFLAVHRGYGTFSNLDARDHPLEQLCQAYLSSVGSATHQALGSQIIHDPKMRFAYWCNGRLALIHSVVLYQLDGRPCYLAVSSDTIGSYPLVSSQDLHMFDRYFLGMMAANNAQTSHFPTVDAFRPVEVPKHGDDDAETNTLTELGFPDAVEETIPVFTLLPQVLPIPPGFLVPVGLQVDQPLPQGRTYHPTFEAWCAAVRHCHSYNGGRPLNTPTENRLFQAASFADWEELNAVDLNDPNSTEVSTAPTPVPEYSATAVAIRDRIMAISEASLLYWYQDAQLTADESLFLHPAGPQQQAQSPSNDVFLTLAKGLTDAKSSKDHIDSQDFDTLLIKYRLLLSYTPDGASLAYAELAPTVKAAFRLRNNVTRANQVRQAYKNFVDLQEARI
ncbi:hypothetical protein IV203_034050 [Nitzschia inconspicua]|uniref:Uncharacterized protein n=1 Tax=Nitzschia inconspicua TaxID=303405 RepID=A0A9K3M576_9STRA|nr:hypothetical protein IV203_034050 [Nitzschia inconspicua]